MYLVCRVNALDTAEAESGRLWAQPLDVTQITWAQQTKGYGAGAASAEYVQLFDIFTSGYATLTVSTVYWARVQRRSSANL